MRIFPNAKVVLTIRDPVKWYESVKQTIFQTKDFIHGTIGVFLRMVGTFELMTVVNRCSNQLHPINKQGILLDLELNIYIKFILLPLLYK